MIVGGDIALGGLVVSTLALVVILVCVDRLITSDFGSGVARWTVLVIACGPVSFFLLAGYSESLFLALSVGTVLSARRRWWGLAAVVGVFATLCRPTGVLLAAPLAVEAAMDAIHRHRTGMRTITVGHLAALAPVGGVIGVTVVAGAVLGVPWGSFGAAARWGQRPVVPWVAVADSVHAVFSGRHPEELVNLASVALLVVTVALMWRRVPASYLALSAVSIPVVAFREADLSPLMSASRYVLVVFPVAVILGRAAEQHPRAGRLCLAGSAVSMAALLAFWSAGNFVA